MVDESTKKKALEICRSIGLTTMVRVANHWDNPDDIENDDTMPTNLKLAAIEIWKNARNRPRSQWKYTLDASSR